jgi:hypothetical protein
MIVSSGMRRLRTSQLNLKTPGGKYQPGEIQIDQGTASGLERETGC